MDPVCSQLPLLLLLLTAVLSNRCFILAIRYNLNNRYLRVSIPALNTILVIIPKQVKKGGIFKVSCADGTPPHRGDRHQTTIIAPCIEVCLSVSSRCMSVFRYHHAVRMQIHGTYMYVYSPWWGKNCLM